MTVTYDYPVGSGSSGGQHDKDYVMAPRAIYESGTVTNTYYYAYVHVSGELGRLVVSGLYLEWCSFFKDHYDPIRKVSYETAISMISVFHGTDCTESNRIADYNYSGSSFPDIDLDVSAYTDICVLFWLKNDTTAYCKQGCITPETYWKVKGPRPVCTSFDVSRSNRTFTATFTGTDYSSYTFYSKLGSADWVAMSGDTYTVDDSYEGYVSFKVVMYDEDGEAYEYTDYKEFAVYAVPTGTISYSKSGKWTVLFNSSTTHTTAIYWYMSESGGSYTQFSTDFNPYKTFTTADAKKTYTVYALVNNNGQEQAYTNYISFTLPSAEDTFAKEYRPRDMGLGGVKTNLEHNGGNNQ